MLRLRKAAGGPRSGPPPGESGDVEDGCTIQGGGPPLTLLVSVLVSVLDRFPQTSAAPFCCKEWFASQAKGFQSWKAEALSTPVVITLQAPCAASMTRLIELVAHSVCGGGRRQVVVERALFVWDVVSDVLVAVALLAHHPWWAFIATAILSLPYLALSCLPGVGGVRELLAQLFPSTCAELPRSPCCWLALPLSFEPGQPYYSPPPPRPPRLRFAAAAFSQSSGCLHLLGSAGVHRLHLCVSEYRLGAGIDEAFKQALARGLRSSKRAQAHARCS